MKPTITYRPEIDGLRALVVLSVIFTILMIAGFRAVLLGWIFSL
ncbi:MULTISPECIES: hypothetical protein [unclassified Moraxella]